MSDTEVVEAPEAEEPTEAPDDTELTPDDDLEPDDEAETIDGPDEPGEPFVTAQTEQEIEKRTKALEREAERHEKRIRELLGDDFEGIVKCEACPENISGYHYAAEFFPPGSPDHSLYVMLGGDDVKPMRQPDYLVVCDECNGHGSVLTGAVTELTRTIPCPVCKLSGYRDTRTDATAPPIPDLPEGETPPVGPAAPTDGVERDMWGRPNGHPRFWQPPFAMTPQAIAEDLADGYTVDQA